MTTLQKVIKYLAIAFAIFLTVIIISSILGAVGLFGGLFEGDTVLEDAKTYMVSDNIRELSININAADFMIKQAEKFSVESNLNNLTVKEKDGLLIIKEEKRLGAYNGAMLILDVPANTVFEKADIVTGAGRVTVDALSAASLNLELGAGEVNITALTATSKANIDGGAGKISIYGGTLNNLDLDMGVGQFNLTSVVLGNSKFDLGIGESNITLIGSKNDYNIDAEKGIGNITVNGENVSHFEGGSGKNYIDISGGIGAVNLVFREEYRK